MAKIPANHGKAWTEEDVQQLKELAKHNTPTPVIGLKMERTPEAIRSAASAHNISLKPINRSPYGRTE